MRNKLLDEIRLIAAFMVVLIHSPWPGVPGQAVEAIARMAVPLFFMISGYYAFGKSKEKLWKSAKKTAIMLFWSVGVYWVWGILWSFYRGTTKQYISASFSVKTLVETVVFNNGTLLGHLWFLLALLYCYLIYAFLFRKTPAYVKTGVSAFLLVGFFVVRELLKMNNVSDPVYYLRNFVFVGLPFFIIGTLVNQYKERLTHVSPCVWLALICVGTVLAISERFYIGCCDLYLGTAFAVVALFVVAQKPVLQGRNVLAELGERHAGNVYIFHCIIITLLNAVASVLGVLSVKAFVWFRPVIVFAVSVCVSYVITTLEGKILKKR